MFDPFYEEKEDPEFDKEYFEEGITFISDQPKKANRSVSCCVYIKQEMVITRQVSFP